MKSKQKYHVYLNANTEAIIILGIGLNCWEHVGRKQLTEILFLI